MEITGPTLIDLKIRTNSNYEDVATAVSGRSAGYFIGSALGGVLVDKFGLFCDLMIAVCLDGGAIATIGVPWVPSTELIWFLCCMQGTFEGVINIGIFYQYSTAFMLIYEPFLVKDIINKRLL